MPTETGRKEIPNEEEEKKRVAIILSHRGNKLLPNKADTHDPRNRITP